LARPGDGNPFGSEIVGQVGQDVGESVDQLRSFKQDWMVQQSGIGRKRIGKPQFVGAATSGGAATRETAKSGIESDPLRARRPAIVVARRIGEVP
jgi:hypothetical protein